jgi:6-pyruvoyltetrahydropterin/6-carboxytetrahydropterin synthase
VIILYLEINGWDAGIKFSACHFIPQHEKCGQLHGHTYAVNLRVHGTLDRRGIIVDFIKLKELMRAIVEKLDHRLLLPQKSRSMKATRKGKVLAIIIGRKVYQIPVEDTVFLDIDDICSAERVALYLLNQLCKMFRFPNNVSELELGVDEGIGQGAWVSTKLRSNFVVNDEL